MDQQPSVCPAHTTQYVGIFIIGLLVGVGATFAFKQPTGDNSYEAGFNAAKKRVEESSFGMMLRTPDDIRNVSGTVTAVNGNRVTLHTASQNPFQDTALDDRTIVITNDTKISRIGQKDPKIIQEEMAAFAKKTNESKSGVSLTTPPEPFTRTSATIADITIGKTLSVTAGSNIKTAKEFTATEVQIQSN